MRCRARQALDRLDAIEGISIILRQRQAFYELAICRRPIALAQQAVAEAAQR